jgi:excinuclease ABC subunit C
VSELDSIKGIGEATISKVLQRFKSVKRLREASLEDLASEIGQAKAKVLYEGLHQ